MRTRLITMAALAMSGALTLSAQTPQRPPQGDTTQRTGAAEKAQAVTVTGCLKAEKDVPGRRPNMTTRTIDTTRLTAFDVHVHLEHTGEATEADKKAADYFKGGAPRDRSQAY